MKLFSTPIIILLFTALFVALPTSVFAAPGIPHQFYGTVNFENGAAPDGLTVEAKVGGSSVGSAITKNGKYGYNPSLLFASKSDGEWNGEMVSFFVSGTDTGETHPLARGGYTELNLTIPASLPTTSTPTSGSTWRKPRATDRANALRPVGQQLVPVTPYSHFRQLPLKSYWSSPTTPSPTDRQGSWTS